MGVNDYDFDDRLKLSKGVVKGTSVDTIMSILEGCVGVTSATEAMDKTGVDYIATLRGQASVYIDHKTREPGCRRYWKYGVPEMALERWSVMPEGGYEGKAGWTLDESKATHYILYTWDWKDSTEAYLLPFQLLRLAFRHNFNTWWDSYRHEIQASSRNGIGWKSEAIFVPATVVVNAIAKEMHRPAEPELVEADTPYKTPVPTRWAEARELNF